MAGKQSGRQAGGQTRWKVGTQAGWQAGREAEKIHMRCKALPYILFHSIYFFIQE